MIKVLVVEDQALVREGICALLQYSDNIEVTGSAENGEAALEIIRTQPPDVLLMDIRMPGLSGIEVMRIISMEHTGLPVILLTTFDDPQLIAQGLQAGASGYLLKDVSMDQLVSAIEMVDKGGVVLHPDINRHILPQLVSQPGVSKQEFSYEALTARESEILKLMAKGLGNREIACAIHLAGGTVKNHVSAIYQKLSVSTRTQAVITAANQGLLDD